MATEREGFQKTRLCWAGYLQHKFMASPLSLLIGFFRLFLARKKSYNTIILILRVGI